MAEETHDLKIDKQTGIITIDGNKYFAHKLTYDVVEHDKVKTLIIRAPGGFWYRFETQKRSFLGGYGKVGATINSFLIDFPHAKTAATVAVERKERAEAASRVEEVKAKQRRAILSGNIPHIDPPAGTLLKRGEYAIFHDINVRFCQEKTKTTYYGGSVRVRVCKGVSIGGGRGTPVKEEYIATLDTGQLTLTNKRLIFSGDRKSTTVNLSKITSIDRYSDAIDLAREGVVKKTIFINIDGDLYATVIERLVSESD